MTTVITNPFIKKHVFHVSAIIWSALGISSPKLISNNLTMTNLNSVSTVTHLLNEGKKKSNSCLSDSKSMFLIGGQQMWQTGKSSSLSIFINKVSGLQPHPIV